MYKTIKPLLLSSILLSPCVIATTTLDFGDAPDSYNTILSSNGARHEIDGVTWLGSSVDSEADAAQSPNSDDSLDSDDEDGVSFVTALEPGLDSVLSVTASTTGYLSAWFDWNQDGDFDDEGEQLITDALLSSGSNSLSVAIPDDALIGETWSRFRFSQDSGLTYADSSTSGEVEDYLVTIADANTVTRYFPSSSGYVTLAYEDEWPRIADYDMNDLVLNYRVTEVLRDGLIAKVVISGKLAAVGGDYHNGFAVRLEGIDSDLVDAAKTRLYYNNVLQDGDPQESDMDEASFIIINDAIELADYQCDYFRTEDSCRENIGVEFELDISFSAPISPIHMPNMPYDPLMFATPGHYHGPSFALPPGRSYEVHLANQAPTEKFDTSFYQMEDDTSDPSFARYFKTSNNMPWALMIFDEWQWPLEQVNLTEAYPNFADYTTSGGTTDTNWYYIDNAIFGTYY